MRLFVTSENIARFQARLSEPGLTDLERRILEGLLAEAREDLQVLRERGEHDDPRCAPPPRHAK